MNKITFYDYLITIDNMPGEQIMKLLSCHDDETKNIYSKKMAAYYSYLRKGGTVMKQVKMSKKDFLAYSREHDTPDNPIKCIQQPDPIHHQIGIYTHDGQEITVDFSLPETAADKIKMIVW